MMDLVFDVLFAFQPIIMTFIALICLGIGALMSGDFIHWRTNAKRVKGRIVTYSQKISPETSKSGSQIFYYPIIEFRNERGEVQKLTSGVGSSRLNESKIGQAITVLYFPKKDSDPRILGSGWVFFIVGLVMVGAGLFIAYQAYLLFEFTQATAIAVILFIGFLWTKFERLKKPLGHVKNLKSFKKEFFKNNPDITNLKKQGGKELSHQEVKQIQKTTQAQQARWSWLILIIGMGLMTGAYYIGENIWYLEQFGIQADGKVIDMKANTDSDGTTYAPIVQYKTQEGQTIKFTSNYSSNPPSYERGDNIKVLYDKDDPKDNVMIDGGYWNWLLPAILGGIGLILSLIIFPSMRRSTSKAL